MDKPVLSKSTYIRSLQCPKSLYLHKKRPFLRDKLSPEQRAKFERGTDIGILARELFPGGYDCSHGSPLQYAKAIQRTAEAIKSGGIVLYEAAFLAKGVLIFLDILVRDGDEWKAYEVKSSARLSSTYFDDAALQLFVLRESGLPVSSFHLVFVDSDYEWEEPPRLECYFRIADVTDEVTAMQDKVEANIDVAKTAVNAGSSPPVPVGKHCFLPYPCDFRGHCWKKIPSPNIFDIPLTGWEEKEEWYQMVGNDLSAMSSIPLADVTQLDRISSLVSGEAFRSDDLEEHLPISNDDIFFIDLAISFPALPLATGHKPYQPLAFACAVISGSHKDEIPAFSAGSPEEAHKELVAFLGEYLSGAETIMVWGQEASDMIAHLLPGREFNIIDLGYFYGSAFFYPGLPKATNLRDLGEAAGIETGAYYSPETDAHQFVMHWHGKAKKPWDRTETERHCRVNVRILQQVLEDMSNPPDVDK